MSFLFFCSKKGLFFLLSVSFFVLSFFLLSNTPVSAATISWDGGGADNNWSTCANWSSDTCPGSNDLATFGATSTKDAFIDASFAGSVQGLQITSGYSGTITLQRSLTTGNTGYLQAAGTVALGSNSFTMSGTGSFTKTAGTFDASSGTLIFTGTSSTYSNNSTTQTVANLTINKSTGFGLTITSGQTIEVTATTTLTSGGYSTGNVNAKGNITQASTYGGGNGTLNFSDDTVAQTFTINGGTGQTLVLDSSSDANDSIVLTTDAALIGLTLSSSFSGTAPFTYNSHNLTIGNYTAGSFIQQAGTFVAPPTLTLPYNFTRTGGTFTAGSGTVIFNTSSFGVGATYSSTATTTFNNVTFNHDAVGTSLSNGNIVVNGTLTFTAGSVNSGTIYAYGNIVVGSSADGGSAVVNFADDSTSQTMTMNGGAAPILNLDSSSDANDSITLTANSSLNGLILASTFSGTAPFTYNGFNLSVGNYNNGSFIQQAGTFIAPTATLTLPYNFTKTGGIFSAGSGTVVFTPNPFGAGSTYSSNATETFNNVTINGNAVTVGLSNGTLIVGGNLTLTDGAFGSGTLDVKGNVSAASTFDGGNAILQFSGTGTQTFNLTGATGTYNGDIVINKSSGSVDLSSALVLDASNQDLTITAGMFNLNGNNLTVNGSSGTMLVGSSGVVQLNGNETLTTNSGFPSLQASSTIQYVGSSGPYTLKNYLYSNLTINGSGATFNLPADTNIGGNLTITNGILDVTASNYNLNVSGNFINNGTYTARSATTTLSASESIFSSSAFNNLVIGGQSVMNAYWNFDEGTGSTAADSSGNSNNGSLQASPTWTTGQISNALQFNGTSQYVDVGNGSTLQISGIISLSAWVKPSAFPSVGNYGVIVEKGYDGSNEGYYIRLQNPSGTSQLNCGSFNGTTSFGTTWNQNWTTGTWHQVICLYDGSKWQLYADGVNVASSTAASGALSTSKNVKIGAADISASVARFFNGVIDDVRIYNRVLTTSEISSLASGSSFPSNATSTLASAITVSGNLNIASNGILDTSTSNCSSTSCNISVGGNWINSGSFLARSSTVTFNGTNQKLFGNNTFTNLTKIANSTDTIYFEAGKTQTITGTAQIQGASGNILSLRSTSDGTQWKIDPQSTRNFSYLNVKDSNNTNASAILAYSMTSVSDGTNDTNWTFISPNSAPTTPTSLTPSGGNWTTNNKPALTFTTADPDADNVQYRLQIDDTSDFSSPVVNYLSAFGAPGTTTFTVGQAAGSGSYTVGSSGQSLGDSATYYWRVLAGDTSFASSSYATSTSGAVSFKVDTTAPNVGTVIFGAISTTTLTATTTIATDTTAGLAATPYQFHNTTLNVYSGATTSLSWLETGLTPNTQYTFEVSATDAAGNVATSSTSNKYTAANIPSSLVLTVDGTDQITASWNANSNPLGTEFNITNITLATSSGLTTNTSWVFSGLTASTPYSFSVLARNGNGLQTASTSISIATTSAVSSGGTLPSSSGSSASFTSAVAIAVSPTTVTMLPNASLAFTADITGSDTKGVIWSVEETNGGSITVNGLYTAPNQAGTYHIRAASRVDTNKYGRAEIVVQQPKTTIQNIEIYPQTITLPPNTSFTFSSNHPVTWFVQDSQGGVITSNGSYTAPKNPGRYTITAISTEDSTKVSSAQVVVSSSDIQNPSTIKSNSEGSSKPAISPEPIVITATTTSDGSINLFAFETDVHKTIWKIQEPNGGTIDRNDVYKAPAEAGAYKLVGTDDVTGTITHIINVFVTPVSKVQVQISPISVEMVPNSSVTFSVTVTDAKNNAVVWKVLEANGGSVTQTGVYRAPVKAGIYHVVVSSVEDSSRSANAVVTVGSTNTFEKLLSNLLDSGKIIIENPIGKALVNLGVILAIIQLVINGVGSVVRTSLFKLGSLFASFVGLKKRFKPWGTVYDSVTKQPLDPAYVRLLNTNGKEVATAITDLDGRYGFFVAPGTYKLVVEKTNYSFPSKILAGEAGDELYGDLYHGGEITIANSTTVITKNIPMDPFHSDWNEMAKKNSSVMKFYSWFDLPFAKVTTLLFFLGSVIAILTAITVPAPYNIIILVLYGVVYLLRKFGITFRSYGTVRDDQGRPLSYGVVRIYSQDFEREIAHKVCDMYGRYYCVVPNGSYSVQIDKKNRDGSYSQVFTTEIFEVKNGIIKKSFKV